MREARTGNHATYRPLERSSTICIVGLGLMGGSLALALRASQLPVNLVGVARNPATIAAARSAGAIDYGTADLAEGAAGADVVVLATPVRTILRMLPQVGQCARPGALVLDLGSSKKQVCDAMADLPDKLQPVGGHPMCGKEVAGFGAAEAGLFRDRPFVLCPLPRTGPAALDRAIGLAEAAGARPLLLDPALHDRAVAGVSHLPYAVAVALVNCMDAADDSLARSLASSGFRDTSRLAASEVGMMLDILVTNRDAVLAWLDVFAGQLDHLRSALAGGDESVLSEMLASAQHRRSSMVF
jgi:prephenate dehydrogenase